MPITPDAAALRQEDIRVFTAIPNVAENGL